MSPLAYPLPERLARTRSKQKTSTLRRAWQDIAMKALIASSRTQGSCQPVEGGAPLVQGRCVGGHSSRQWRAPCRRSGCRAPTPWWSATPNASSQDPEMAMLDVAPAFLRWRQRRHCTFCTVRRLTTSIFPSNIVRQTNSQ